MQTETTRQAQFTLFITLLAFCVILLGAYVRLSNAGLGCPDWPGCYGQLSVPNTISEINQANQAFPNHPLEAAKAWKEMVHRYLAGFLGLCIILLALLAWHNRDRTGQPLLLPGLLVAIVLFQTLLGMWTVTLQVKPIIVVTHLLGGLTTLALLWALTMRLAAPPQGRAVVSGRNKLILIARIGLIILLIQVTLGGWMSSNYAANGCIEFPTCHSGLWWPTMNFREAFVIWRGIGINYEFGILSGAARTAIHMAHRTGALITCLYLGWLSFHLFRHAHSERIVSLNILLLTGLSLQVGLGITNVLAQLPLSIAVAHNGMAALLVLVLLTIVRRLKRANAFD